MLAMKMKKENFGDKPRTPKKPIERERRGKSQTRRCHARIIVNGHCEFSVGFQKIRRQKWQHYEKQKFIQQLSIQISQFVLLLQRNDTQDKINSNFIRMGCGSKIIEQDIVGKLLNTENIDFISPTKEMEMSSWNCVSEVNNSINSSKTVPKKSLGKPANTSRPLFGPKSNHKINNFNFQYHDSIDDYLVQYRLENKAIRCLSPRPDPARAQSQSVSKSFGDSAPAPSRHEPAEKSLVHHVRFWQAQNTDAEKSRQIECGDAGECQRPLMAPQITGSVPVSMVGTGYGQRSSFQNKRSLDMIVPQGTTYDILADDNRLSGNVEIDRLTVNIKDRTQSLDGLSLINFPYHATRETNKQKTVCKEGSLEFAKLLDEKLRMLYEQKNPYQPPIEFNRIKPETKPKKSTLRQKSANFQFRNDYLNTLSINGKSTGGVGKSSIVSVPKTAEDQWNFFTPCLLPQMPAFGTQNYPRFITSTAHSHHKLSYNNSYQNNQHDE